MKLSPAYSTISSGAVASAVQQHYDLGPVVQCRLVHRGFNDTYELNFVDGTSRMARLSNLRFRGPANLDYETAFLTHLSCSGVVVGTPVRDREGRLWRAHDAPEGERRLTLFTRLSGRLAAIRRCAKDDAQTLADVAALGESLARIHEAGDRFDGPPSLYRVQGSLLLEDPLKQFLAVFDGELAAQAHAVGERLRAQLAACAGSLSIGHCHGDNHAFNTLIADAPDGARVAGWFDFDDGGPGFLAYDLATFLWSLLLRTPRGELTEETPPLWQAFITGYRTVRAIPATDLDAVGLFVSLRHMWIVGNFASRLTNVPIPDDWFAEALALIRRWDGVAAPAVEG